MVVWGVAGAGDVVGVEVVLCNAVGALWCMVSEWGEVFCVVEA